MDDVERLAAIQEISQLKARYFRCMDTKDWAGLAEVFAADAVMDMQEEAGATVEGNQAIADFVRSSVEEVVTVHHGHMPEITLESPTEASGIWAMEDVLQWPEGSPIAAMHGFGHYHERYVKRDGAWRIAHLRLSRLRRDFTFPEG
jgi:uncharacterized protein (TIGR02246 family)